MQERAGSFEYYLKKAEEVIKALESGQLPLEEAIERYGEGIQALAKCKEILNKVEQKLEILMKSGDGTLTVQDFDIENPTDEKSV